MQYLTCCHGGVVSYVDDDSEDRTYTFLFHLGTVVKTRCCLPDSLIFVNHGRPINEPLQAGSWYGIGTLSFGVGHDDRELEAVVRLVLCAVWSPAISIQEAVSIRSSHSLNENCSCKGPAILSLQGSAPDARSIIKISHGP